MLVLNFRNGQSATYNLDSRKDLGCLALLEKQTDWPSRVAAVALVCDGTRLVAPVHRSCQVDVLSARIERNASGVPWGERARVYSSGIETVLTIPYRDPSTVRVDVRRVGKVRYRSPVWPEEVINDSNTE